MRIPSFRPLIWTAVALGLMVAAVDGGSVLLTRLQLPDQLRTAGHVAAEAAVDQPVTRRTAQIALGAAELDARQHGIVVPARTFALQADGQVTLTGRRTAPTLVLRHVDALRDLAVVRETVTVGALPFR